MIRAQVWVKIPNRYELACDELRAPKKGEWYLDLSGKPYQADHSFTIPYIIVRPIWQWPVWLKCRWIARCSDGMIALGRCDLPIEGREYWCSKIGCDYVSASSLDLNLPEGDWRKSLRMNPNREAKS